MKRKLKWLLINAVWLWLIWFGAVNGNVGALRVLDVFIPFTAIVVMLQATEKGKRDYWKANPDGAAFPVWFEAVYDIGAISVLAYFDHIVLAVWWIAILMGSQALFVKPKEKEAS